MSFDELLTQYEISKDNRHKGVARAEARYELLLNLLKGSNTVLENPLFINLLNDEFVEVLERRFFNHARLNRISKINTLSKACRTRGNHSDEVLEDLTHSYNVEFRQHTKYSKFINDLIDWIWKEINGSDNLNKQESKRFVLEYANLYLGSLNSINPDNTDVESLAQFIEVVDIRYQQANSITGFTLIREEVIYSLLILSFLHYSNGDIISFKYYLMRAHSLNLREVPISLVIELLANQFLLD